MTPFSTGDGIFFETHVYHAGPWLPFHTRITKQRRLGSTGAALLLYRYVQQFGSIV